MPSWQIYIREFLYEALRCNNVSYKNILTYRIPSIPLNRDMPGGQLCVFDVTLKADASNVTVDAIKLWLKKVAKKWTFQRELAEDGYDHYQIRLSLKKKTTENVAVKLYRTQWGDGVGRISVTSQNEADMAMISGDMFYVQKEETRTDGPWTDRDAVPTYVQKRFQKVNLRPWQQELIQECKMQLAQRNDRNIIMVMDATGNNGKSFLRGYAKQRLNWVTVPSTCMTTQEMIQYLCSNDKIKEGWHGVILMDVPRATSQKHWYTLARGLETIKQGELYDGRYKMQEKIIEPPVMVVFVNALPPPEVMSSDVFQIIHLNA